MTIRWAALALALWIAGCGKDIECGPGTGLSDGKCLPLATTPAIDSVLDKLEAFKKQLCDCSDWGCGQKVNASMAAWNSTVKTTMNATDKLSADQSARMAILLRQYEDCVKKLTDN